MTKELTEQQREAVEASKAQGIDFSGVSAEMVFSGQSDGGLALKVFRLRPDRYYELKQEWLYQSGAESRPLQHWK